MDTILIGLLGGLVTGISPCILPVLPVIFLTVGAQSARIGGRPEAIEAPHGRPYFVIAGLVTSFTLVTLAGSVLLGLLGLPQSVIRWVGIAVLAIIGVGLMFPSVEQLLEKPFQWLPRRRVDERGNGFGMGLALGAVFVPCAGPVLAAIIVAGTTGSVGMGTVLLTVSFAVGVAIPLLVFALAGRGLVERIRAFRSRERAIRITAGAAMIALAIGLVFNVPQALQRLLPDYTAGLQRDLTESDAGKRALDLGGLVNDENRELDRCSNGAAELESCGQAPSIWGIEQWFNTPDDAGIDLQDLRGSVVLIDFWAYSCINCQRSVPHVVAWDQSYRGAGLTVIGVHSPEYAFEKDAANVRAGAEDFGITYPVALDNKLSTWTNYRNRYWPAHYLIDAEGTVRHVAFGEGNYAATEKLIRELLVEANPGAELPAPTDVADLTPEAGTLTPETFIGSSKDRNYGGAGDYRSGTSEFAFPEEQDRDTFALDGAWHVSTQSATPAEQSGRMRLSFTARQVRVVVAGEGTIETTDQDGRKHRVRVSGAPRSYGLVDVRRPEAGVIDLEVPRGVDVYSFTFG